MDLLITRLTSKNQTTIPKEVREVLHLHPKDRIVYEISKDNTVIIRKAKALDLEYLSALPKTLNEWESEEDEEAYGSL